MGVANAGQQRLTGRAGHSHVDDAHGVRRVAQAIERFVAVECVVTLNCRSVRRCAASTFGSSSTTSTASMEPDVLSCSGAPETSAHPIRNRRVVMAG
jgi:hypothetical protein